MSEKHGMTQTQSIEDPQARVLVIDDDPALVRLLRLTLRGGGFDVSSASNGEEGLVEAVERPPDAIVLDLEMPVMDGRTFYRELRRQHINSRVLILSANDPRAAQRELGADGYLAKPFDADYLVECVSRLV